MVFDPTKVSNPGHNLVLDKEGNAYYTDAAGNKIPAFVAVTPDTSNALVAYGANGTLASTDLEKHDSSAITEEPREPLFISAGGQKLPIIALLGFDTGKALKAPVLTGGVQGVPGVGFDGLNSVAVSNKATGGSVGAAAITVDAGQLLLVNQTTAAQTLTLPSPTNATPKIVLVVVNTGSASFTMLSQTVAAGAGILAVWTGAAWAFIA